MRRQHPRPRVLAAEREHHGCASAPKPSRSPIIHGFLGADVVAGSVTDGPVLRRIAGFEPGNADTKEGVVWAFPPAMSVSEGDSLGRGGCSSLLAGQRSVAQL